MKATFTETGDTFALFVECDTDADSILMRSFVEQAKPVLLLDGKKVAFVLNVESRASMVNQ